MIRIMDELRLQFYEAQLPLRQPPILTAGVQDFILFVKFLREPKATTGYTVMGVVTGRAGVGKTIAIDIFLQQQISQPHTGAPACIRIRVKPNSTPKAVVEDVLTILGESVSRLHHNRYELADDAVRAILSNDIQLIFVDEADQLNEEGFEFLRYIFDKTGCPIVIVGLRPILTTIDRHDKFKSRIGPRLDFSPPTEEEVLNIILPQMVIPHWQFTPEKEEDLVVGKALWARVQPSFRDLRVVLQIASWVAEQSQASLITPDILKQTYRFIRGQGYSGKYTEEEEEEEQESPLTPYEKESYQRQEARRKKREGKQKA